MSPQRRRAIALYHAAPNLCRECGKPILVRGDQKVTDVRRKKFCNLSCSATHHNRSSRRVSG